MMLALVDSTQGARGYSLFYEGVIKFADLNDN